jgi:hypothetical protein
MVGSQLHLLCDLGEVTLKNPLALHLLSEMMSLSLLDYDEEYIITSHHTWSWKRAEDKKLLSDKEGLPLSSPRLM